MPYDQIAMHGAPLALRVDNGPELKSIALTRWCVQRHFAVHYIQPGKPQQNAYIKRFNRAYRTEILDAHAFDSLAGVRELTADWLTSYNNERPHDSLGRVLPFHCSPRSTARPESRSPLST